MTGRAGAVAVGIVASLTATTLSLGSASASSPVRAVNQGSEGKVIELPAVGEAVTPRVKVFSKPRSDSHRLKTMKAFRFDYRQTVFFVTALHSGGSLGSWYRIEIPGRPNGGRGWVRAPNLRLLRSVGQLHIVIERSRFLLKLKRGSRTVLRLPVAVGAPDAPTPLGNFYVTAAFAPDDDFLGPWAFETSAYAAITDWPRGGIVGLHGTSEPYSIGHRESHGCIRTYNWAILKLKKHVRPGTPIRIRR